MVYYQSGPCKDGWGAVGHWTRTEHGYHEQGAGCYNVGNGRAAGFSRRSCGRTANNFFYRVLGPETLTSGLERYSRRRGACYIQCLIRQGVIGSASTVDHVNRIAVRFWRRHRGNISPFDYGVAVAQSFGFCHAANYYFGRVAGFGFCRNHDQHGQGNSRIQTAKLGN